LWFLYYCYCRDADTDRKTRQENILSGKTDTSIFGSKKQGIYVYENGDIKSLSIDHPDVLSREAKHINYRGGDIKEQERKDEIQRQRKVNDGYTDKQMKANAGASERIRKYTITHENWRAGRVKYSERMERKEFTEKELEKYASHNDMVRNHWGEQTDEYKMERTKNGLDNMNSRMICEHCDVEANKGNYARWHGDKCKMRKVND